MKHNKLLITISVLSYIMLAYACTGAGEGDSAKVDFGTPSNVDGKHMVVTQCATCHSPASAKGPRVAPTFTEVKQYYIEEDTRLEDFKAEVMAYLKAPKPEHSRVPNAIKKYGVMPMMGYADSQIEAAAEYIFKTDLSKASAFVLSDSAPVEVKPIAQGMQYALASKAVLGKNLMGALKAKGPVGALGFCNEQAINLTDSMTSVQSASQIKRVSDKPRNPQNRANADELTYIKSQKERLSAGEEMKPQIIEMDGAWHAYYPIVTNDMCMQCHGQVDDNIKPETAAAIKDLYPQDEATGYGPEELRGIWVVDFPKQ